MTPDKATQGGQTRGVELCWDDEDCPRDCNGELQQQDRMNVMCLSCNAVWAHYVTESEHKLLDEKGRTQARKPRTENTDESDGDA